MPFSMEIVEFENRQYMFWVTEVCGHKDVVTDAWIKGKGGWRKIKLDSAVRAANGTGYLVDEPAWHHK
jgi:hypothetical protein